MRKTPFVNGEYYHIYNRGVDKRNTFEDQEDFDRFFQSMKEFNVIEPVGSIHELTFKKKNPKLGGSTSKSGRLVDFISYCINPNHYHFILSQTVEGGVSEFMKRLSGGYTYYFNNKKKRSGALFQGRFKSIHINSNEYLLHLSAYVNLNNRVHQLGGSTSKLVKTSWDEYVNTKKVRHTPVTFCNKRVVLGQFSTPYEYRSFAENTLKDILNRRSEEMESLIIEEL